MNKHRNIVGVLWQVIQKVTEREKSVIFSVVCALVALLEIGAYFNGLIRIIASRVWAIGGVFCFLFIVKQTAHLLYVDLKKKQWANLVFGLILLLLLIVPIVNNQIGDISYEAALEIKGGLHALSQSDWNYIGREFLNYPARQYIVNAVPTILFGRSVYALRAGFGYVFVTGLLAFYAGIRRRCEESGIHPLLSFVPVFGLFVFPYLAEQYLLFEQVIAPVSYTMMIIGLGLLIDSNSPSYSGYYCFLWVGCMLCHIYTPALSVMGLVFVILILKMVGWAKTDRLKGGYGLCIWLVMVVFLVTGYLRNHTIHGMQEAEGARLSAKNVFLIVTNSLFDRQSVFWGALGFIVIIYFFMSLTGRLTIYDAVVSLWTMAVIIASIVLKGYASFENDYKVFYHRIILCVPVILTMWFLAAMRFIKKQDVKIQLSAIVSLLCTCFVFALNNYTVPHPTSNIYNTMAELFIISEQKELEKHGVAFDDEFNIIICDGLLGNYYDFAGYFYPNAKVCYLMRASDEEIDYSKPTFIYQEDPLPLYYKEYKVTEIKENKWKDKKWDKEYIWYSGFLQLENS